MLGHLKKTLNFTVYWRSRSTVVYLTTIKSFGFVLHCTLRFFYVGYSPTNSPVNMYPVSIIWHSRDRHGSNIVTALVCQACDLNNRYGRRIYAFKIYMTQLSCLKKEGCKAKWYNHAQYIIKNSYCTFLCILKIYSSQNVKISITK